MSKCRSPSIRSYRKKRKKSPTTATTMEFRVSQAQETVLSKTIKTLHQREYQKNVDRDRAFVKFLGRVYRERHCNLRPAYGGAANELLSSCADEVYRFKGVNKESKEDDEGNLLKTIKFDIDEGKSWADQRRAKWIVPLCVGWLDAVSEEVNRLKNAQVLSDSFLTDTIVSLLTTSYHPPRRQANSTQLICTQTMHHKDFRQRLIELTGIDLPRPKDQIGKWLQNVRENGLGAPEASSSATNQDDLLHRELEKRNAMLEQQLLQCQRQLSECQDALYRTQQQRDEYGMQLQQMLEQQQHQQQQQQHQEQREQQQPLLGTTNGWVDQVGGFDVDMPPAVDLYGSAHGQFGSTVLPPMFAFGNPNPPPFDSSYGTPSLDDIQFSSSSRHSMYW